MNIALQPYTEGLKNWPQSGQHILAHQKDNQLIVYQAYKSSIANFAIENQYLGGPEYSYNRMSWIKPNFLWMMYRCGWAEKENQERVLAITITKTNFEEILKEAVISSFNGKYHATHDEWKTELELMEVRMQWDPDHDPYGNKVERRAIQLGLKGAALKKFIQQIVSIEDVTDFVKTQKIVLARGRLDELMVPVETILQTSDDELIKRIGIER